MPTSFDEYSLWRKISRSDWSERFTQFSIFSVHSFVCLLFAVAKDKNANRTQCHNEFELMVNSFFVRRQRRRRPLHSLRFGFYHAISRNNIYFFIFSSAVRSICVNCGINEKRQRNKNTTRPKPTESGETKIWNLFLMRMLLSSSNNSRNIFHDNTKTMAFLIHSTETPPHPQSAVSR